MKKYSWDTIYKKLIKTDIKHYDIDIRNCFNLSLLYPNIFPKCIKDNNFTIWFNGNNYQYYILHGKLKINNKNEIII